MPPRQKRAATSSNSQASSSKQPAKKIRFADPEEDAENFSQEVDSALENPTASRQRQLKSEGYESDSSDDGESVVKNRAKRLDKEDDDMFSMVDGNDEKKNPPSKKETYLRLGDIEGQEFYSPSASECDSEEEPEDEDDAAQRKKAGMGYELSSFNMREEMDEGKFTEDGSYVRTVDPHGIHDRWMEDVSEKEIKLARRRKRHRDKIQNERMAAEERELEESGGKGALEKELLALLKKGETVLEALQRLGQAKKCSRIPKEVKTGHDTSGEQVPKSISNIERIAHLASNIMSLGETDIYSKTYEELVRTVRSSGIVDDTWIPPSADVRYEYKWIVSNQGKFDDVFGPFSEEEMKTWMLASYFGPSGERVQVRCVGGPWGDWQDVVQ